VSTIETEEEDFFERQISSEIEEEETSQLASLSEDVEVRNINLMPRLHLTVWKTRNETLVLRKRISQF